MKNKEMHNILVAVWILSCISLIIIRAIYGTPVTIKIAIAAGILIMVFCLVTTIIGLIYCICNFIKHR